MASVPQTSEGTSLRQPSTTSAESFAQTSQHLNISTNQAINYERYIPEGLNIKEIIGNMELMGPLTYATHYSEKRLLQLLSTESCPVNCVPAWSIDKFEAAILLRPHMSAKSIEARTTLRSEAHTKVQNGFEKY